MNASPSSTDTVVPADAVGGEAWMDDTHTHADSRQPLDHVRLLRDKVAAYLHGAGMDHPCTDAPDDVRFAWELETASRIQGSLRERCQLMREMVMMRGAELPESSVKHAAEERLHMPDYQEAIQRAQQEASKLLGADQQEEDEMLELLSQDDEGSVTTAYGTPQHMEDTTMAAGGQGNRPQTDLRRVTAVSELESLTEKHGSGLFLKLMEIYQIDSSSWRASASLQQLQQMASDIAAEARRSAAAHAPPPTSTKSTITTIKPRDPLQPHDVYVSDWPARLVGVDPSAAEVHRGDFPSNHSTALTVNIRMALKKWKVIRYSWSSDEFPLESFDVSCTLTTDRLWKYWDHEESRVVKATLHSGRHGQDFVFLCEWPMDLLQALFSLLNAQFTKEFQHRRAESIGERAMRCIFSAPVLKSKLLTSWFHYLCATGQTDQPTEVLQDPNTYYDTHAHAPTPTHTPTSRPHQHNQHNQQQQRPTPTSASMPKEDTKGGGSVDQWRSCLLSGPLPDSVMWTGFLDRQRDGVSESDLTLVVMYVLQYWRVSLYYLLTELVPCESENDCGVFVRLDPQPLKRPGKDRQGHITTLWRLCIHYGDKMQSVACVTQWPRAAMEALVDLINLTLSNIHHTYKETGALGDGYAGKKNIVQQLFTPALIEAALMCSWFHYVNTEGYMSHRRDEFRSLQAFRAWRHAMEDGHSTPSTVPSSVVSTPRGGRTPARPARGRQGRGA
ncbi:unnamed protein product [Vitrella brassicaformis CCMP3155]|uniref:Uncharacterized protein n=2 Tax=Vitrella brassicaformis TaxID=1169539 RepID=A0A0G4E9E0_VITBC|nr:unnamed protein product [Vitrella brassicaformis CCMP3155]|eukprot:CEL91996.1 unnamed protein product [Vitrella brassicaformis CCMP3155]